MPIIGIHVTSEGIATSQGDKITTPPFLDYLLECYSNYQKVFYDLDASVAGLCSLLQLTKEQCQKLIKGKLYISGYHLTYFPRYYFAIDYGAWQGHPSVSFANMNQAGYLTAQYSEDNSIEDAIAKAKEAEDTAMRVYKAFETLGLDTTSISSPIASLLKKQQFDWPTEEDCPEEASKMAWEAIKGHWFEIYGQGLFQNCFSYDINGSYAFELSKLPDIRRGQWIESQIPPDNALLGITKGILETDAEFHPFLVKIGKNNYTPTGKMPNILSLQEIQFLKKWQLGTFDIERGYFWIPADTIHNPYKGILLWLWSKKQSSQDQTIRDIITRLYAGLWGKTSQYLPDTGEFSDMFNPIINYTVEANSRLHVAETCLENKAIPLAIVGDGFITDKELSINLSNELGGWKLSKQGQCLITGSGAIAFQSDKPPKGLALHFDTLLEQMKAKPKAKQYPRIKYSPVTLAVALQHDFNELGKVKKVERNLFVGDDNKRIYLERPKNGENLISGKIWQSLPWNYKVLTTIA